MGNNLYDNLLKATNNIDDITTERYATVTKLNGNYCDVKEEDTGLEHTNVPIVNGANLSVGDKAIIGFINNSIYDAVCYGALDKQIHDDSKQDLLVSGQNIKTINHTSLLGSGNIDIQGGSNVDVVTSWEATLSDTKVPSEKLTKNSLDAKADASSLATVATTGDYDDLTDKPSIPSSSSDLSDGSNIVKKSSTSGLLKNDGSVDTTAYSTFDGNYNNLTNKPTIPTIPSKTSQLTNDSGFLTSHQSLSNYYNKSETNNYDVDFILGTQTTSTSAWTGTTSVISSLRAGTTIFYRLPYASTSTSVTLNLTLKGGGTTGAKNVFYKNTTRVTTHFGVGQVVGLTYDGTAWYVISPSDNNSNNDNNYGGIQFKAGEALTTQTICCAKNNGQYYKVANGVVLDIRYPLIMTSSAVTSGTTTNAMYRTWYGVNIANTKSMTLTNGSQLFLEGTAYSDGKFTISSNVVTHTLTNGRYYIKVGTALSTTQIRFISDMTVYYYNGTTLKPVIKKEQIVDFPTLHTVATSGSYNDLLDKPNIPSGVVVDLNLDGTSNNAVANSAVVGGLNDKIEASDISFGFDADTKEIYIEVK